MSVWLITGTSRGFGRSLAVAALHRGHTVVGTTRTGATDPGQTLSIANRARELAGGLDVAAKAALVAVSEALTEELGPLGIGVTVVEPGSFRTEFLTPESVRRTSSSIDDYAATSGLSVSRLDTINGCRQWQPAAGAPRTWR